MENTMGKTHTGPMRSLASAALAWRIDPIILSVFPYACVNHVSLSSNEYIRRYLDIKGSLPERAGSDGHESAHSYDSGVRLADVWALRFRASKC